jgi:hypothetical protein
MAVIQIELLGPRNQKIAASVRPLIPNRDILAWYCEWLPHMFDLSGGPLHEDSRWPVTQIWEMFHQRGDSEVLILEAKDQIQGYIIVYFDYAESSAGIKTYVPFLAAAPWNRMLQPTKRLFANIGKTLVAIASIKAALRNNDPRLELHSLAEAEEFYRRLKMEDTGRMKGGLKEFRLGKEAAYDLLRFVIPYMRRG